MNKLPINQLLNLTGNAAIVTGGGNGIGESIAYRLAEAGSKVLVADIDLVAAERVAQSLNANGWTASAIQVDVSDEPQVQAMIQACQDTFGSVDILVNNAGVFPLQPIATMTYNQFQDVLDVNLGSVFLSTKCASEIMKQQGGGTIINVTSVDALHPSIVGLAHYDASKHGTWGFSKNAALELAEHNIRVNAVAPGGIATPGLAKMSEGASAEQLKLGHDAQMAKIPMHRVGEPDEIGKVVLFLASDMSSYMTGEQIVVDGGLLLS
ncbi:SDR family oxidoreductase [Candidatus Saccharibacteria bacterium]|nr:SDR family oxidoreductase [Candidatus Saccharibacteria bacterium]